MSKQKAWFIKKRGSYLPCSLFGWLTYIPFIAYLVISLLIIRSQFHSAGIEIISVAVQWLAAAVILTWVAQQKS